MEMHPERDEINAYSNRWKIRRAVRPKTSVIYYPFLRCTYDCE
jgi:hypothetical protein